MAAWPNGVGDTAGPGRPHLKIPIPPAKTLFPNSAIDRLWGQAFLSEGGYNPTHYLHRPYLQILSVHPVSRASSSSLVLGPCLAFLIPGPKGHIGGPRPSPVHLSLLF
jgi:hypothetical protein